MITNTKNLEKFGKTAEDIEEMTKDLFSKFEGLDKELVRMIVDLIIFKVFSSLYREDPIVGLGYLKSVELNAQIVFNVIKENPDFFNAESSK